MINYIGIPLGAYFIPLILCAIVNHFVTQRDYQYNRTGYLIIVPIFNILYFALLVHALFELIVEDWRSRK